MSCIAMRHKRAATGGRTAGRMIRAIGGPALAEPNGPVSTPSSAGGQPIRLRPVRSWMTQFSAIHAADAAISR